MEEGGGARGLSILPERRTGRGSLSCLPFSNTLSVEKGSSQRKRKNSLFSLPLPKGKVLRREALVHPFSLLS